MELFHLIFLQHPCDNGTKDRVYAPATIKQDERYPNSSESKAWSDTKHPIIRCQAAVNLAYSVQFTSSQTNRCHHRSSHTVKGSPPCMQNLDTSGSARKILRNERKSCANSSAVCMIYTGLIAQWMLRTTGGGSHAWSWFDP
jgi:hypothetical protein